MTVVDDEATVIGDLASLTVPDAGRRDQAYLIVIAGPNVGEMFKIEAGGAVGRGKEATFRLTDTETSRRHALFVPDDSGIVVKDLNSTNGTFVNGQQLHGSKPLKDGDKIRIGTTTILKFSYHDDLDQQFQRKLFDSAQRDGLTGTFNKRFFAERLETEFAYATRHQSDLALVLLDLDHFKRVNDGFGHLAGDYVLKTMADGVSQSVRKEDVFARYGGEEFVIMTRGVPLDSAARFADRLRAWVEEYPFVFQNQQLPVTISVGVAAMPQFKAATASDLVGAADKALYKAKHGGRNRVEIFQPG